MEIFNLNICFSPLKWLLSFFWEHLLESWVQIGPFQERQTNASFSNALLYELLPSFPKMALGSFGDLLEAHFAFIIHPTLQLFSTSFPHTFFFSLLTHTSLSSTAPSVVWPCKYCLGSRLLSVQELSLKCHLMEFGQLLTFNSDQNGLILCINPGPFLFY